MSGTRAGVAGVKDCEGRMGRPIFTLAGERGRSFLSPNCRNIACGLFGGNAVGTTVIVTRMGADKI